MFASVRNYVYDRRRGLGFVAGVAGGAYLLVKYAKGKLGEMQEKMMLDREARENLRRRFQQNQDDCNFTVLALLPTIANQILEAMDVEKLSSMLQLRIASNKPVAAAAVAVPVQAQAETESSVPNGVAKPDGTEAPFVPPGGGIGREAAPSVEGSPSNGVEAEQSHLAAPSSMTDSTISAALEASDLRTEPAHGPSDTPLANGHHQQSYASVASHAPSENAVLAKKQEESSLGDSGYVAPDVTASVLAAANGTEGQDQGEEERRRTGHGFAETMEGSRRQSPPPPLPLVGRIAEPGVLQSMGPAGAGLDLAEAQQMSKVALWNEIKILSFSRCITSIYVVCLLTLQTHIQLNLLGRYNYVSSVLELADSRIEDAKRPGITMRGFGLGRAEEDGETYEERRHAISLQTERKYLTFSWWLLHQGWKEVAERVSGAVKDVLGPQALKTVVTPDTLWSLIHRIRDIVESEDDSTPSNSASPLSYSFASALFPSTDEDERDVLRQGGIPDSELEVDDELRKLLDETEDFIDSRDFETVRRACLDRLFGVFGDKMGDAFKAAAPVGDRIAEVPTGQAEGEQAEGEQVERTARLASLLPRVERQAHLVLNGMPNEYVDSLNEVKELLEFSAVVYSSFDRSTVEIQ